MDWDNVTTVFYSFSLSHTLSHTLCVYLQFKQKNVLAKYDEEIDGEKKTSFRLNATGCADGERERELQAIRETLRNEAQSLQMPALMIASEYYTEQEMVSVHTSTCMHT